MLKGKQAQYLDIINSQIHNCPCCTCVRHTFVPIQSKLRLNQSLFRVAQRSSVLTRRNYSSENLIDRCFSTLKIKDNKRNLLPSNASISKSLTIHKIEEK